MKKVNNKVIKENLIPETNKVDKKINKFKKLINDNQVPRHAPHVGESQPQEHGREQGCQGGPRDDQGASKEPHAGDLQPHEQGHNHLADHVPEKGTGAVQQRVPHIKEKVPSC